MSEDRRRALETILNSTQRPDLESSLRWLADGQPLPNGTAWTELTMAIVEVGGTGEIADRALRRVVKEAAGSDIDTARLLFDPLGIPKPEDIRISLDEVVSRCDDGKLSNLTPRRLLSAQYANSSSIESLCLAVGVSYSDAKDWFGATGNDWSLEQVTDLLTYLNQLIAGEVRTTLPDSVPSMAIELIQAEEASWDSIDHMRLHGVPYEVLLVQRAVGGTWLAHKNKTSSFSNIAAASMLVKELQEHQITYLRASTVGGDVRQTDLQELTGIRKKQVGLVILSSDAPKFAIAFSSARDGGTARANGDGLMQIPVTELPLALFLTGIGWSSRPETDRLARRFGGRIFTERSVEKLVRLIQEYVA